MSDSENEYEALIVKNLERKQALLAELGLDNLLNEGRRLFSEIRDRNKPSPAIRKKSVFEEKPARRSVRIQKQSFKVKYVKGFLGFDDHSDGQESSDDSDLELSDRCSRGRKLQNRENHIKVQFPWYSKFTTQSKPTAEDDLVNSRADHKETEHEESNVQESKIKNRDLWVEESDTEKYTRSPISENMIKTVPDQNETEIDIPTEDSCGSLQIEHDISEAPVVKNSESLPERKDNTLHNEKLMKTVDKTSILNNNNDDIEIVAEHDYQGIEWNDRSEAVCKQLILKYFQKSAQFKNHDNADTDSEDDWSKYENVMFCISASEDSDDSVDDNEVPRTRKRMSYPNFSYDVPSLSCEDVTEEMLANIAKRSSCKVYDQLNGTTCHQCRQKTYDTKTVCRSGRCVGVRGMFCGICLPKRYGEQVADALKKPEWECPVCRGICNCSFCRARAGKNPTGIMYPEARQHGYNCVAEYLKDKDKDKENIRAKEKKLKVLKS